MIQCLQLGIDLELFQDYELPMVYWYFGVDDMVWMMSFCSYLEYLHGVQSQNLQHALEMQRMGTPLLDEYHQLILVQLARSKRCSAHRSTNANCNFYTRWKSASDILLLDWERSDIGHR